MRHIRAPSGKISVGRGTLARGQLIAQKIVVQKDAILAAVGGCGDGTKEQSEMCDTTASGGDAACPGNCIPLGQAGQCTCRCANNADCNDGNACNGVETCDAGHCVLGTPLNCDDGNACTIDCDPATGCVQIAKADGTGCDDGDECTKGDQCVGGACTPGEPRACNDGNDCTADTCDPAKGCVHTDLGTGLPCSDGNACTQGDACIHGNCIGGTASAATTRTPAPPTPAPPTWAVSTPPSPTASRAPGRARAPRSTPVRPASASSAARRYAATARNARTTAARRSATRQSDAGVQPREQRQLHAVWSGRHEDLLQRGLPLANALR